MPCVSLLWGRTERLLASAPAVAAVMQYMAKVLGSSVVEASMKPVLPASRHNSSQGRCMCLRAALQQNHSLI